MGLALQLISMVSESNWESYWPAIKQALAGLTSGSLLYVAGKAAAKGLPELAERIKGFQPVATPDNPSLPYVPVDLPLPSIDMTQLESDPNAIDFSRVELEGNPFYVKPKDGPTYRIPVPPEAKTGAKKSSRRGGWMKYYRSNPAPDGGDWEPKLPPEITKWISGATASISALRRFAGAMKKLEPNYEIVMKTESVLRALLSSLRLYEHDPNLLRQQSESYLAYLRTLWTQASSGEAYTFGVRGAKYTTTVRQAIEAVGKRVADLITLLEKK